MYSLLGVFKTCLDPGLCYNSTPRDPEICGYNFHWSQDASANTIFPFFLIPCEFCYSLTHISFLAKDSLS